MDNDLIQDTNLDLLQVQVAEVEYSGIAPINVDNQEHTISLDPSALSSKLDTSAFDEWTATHSAAADGFPITATDGNTTWSADCKASAFTMARNTSRTDIGAFGFEYRQAPSVNVSGSWYDLASLMKKFMYAIPTQVVANSGLATGQNILYVVTGS